MKNFSYVAIGQMVSTALQAGFYLIFASLLDLESYGQMSYFIAIAGFFSLFSRFGLGYTVTVYQAKGKSTLANQVNVLALITSGISSLILLPINQYAAILCLSLNFFIMNQHNLLGFKKYKRQMITAIVKSILILTIPIIFYFIAEIPGILLGIAISNFVGSTDYLKSLHRKILFFRDIKKNYKLLVSNFGVDSSSALPIIVDKLLIVPLFGFVYLGLYQFNMQILFALGLVPIVLHTFLLSEESSGKKHKRIIYISLSASILLSIIAIFLAPVIISEFFSKFNEGIFSLQVIILSLVPLTISSIFSAKLQARESTKLIFPAMVRIISLIGFIVILGNFYGLDGLSYAVLISTILYTILLWFLNYKSRVKLN